MRDQRRCVELLFVNSLNLDESMRLYQPNSFSDQLPKLRILKQFAVNLLALGAGDNQRRFFPF
jgi:hypothetical protein